MQTLMTAAGGLVAFAVALGACGDGRREATGTPGGTPKTAAEDCAALLRQPLGNPAEPTACLQAISNGPCRDAVSKAVADKTSRTQIVPAFTACRAAYCGDKVKSAYLCDAPAPSQAGEARDRIGELLDGAIASDQSDTEGKLRGAGFLIEHAVIKTTTIRFAVRTEQDVVITGLGDELRTGRPPGQDVLRELVNRVKAREAEPAFADLLIDAPKVAAAGPVMDILDALKKAGYSHMVLCTSAGNCR